jgi:hypothetical protein
MEGPGVGQQVVQEASHRLLLVYLVFSLYYDVTLMESAFCILLFSDGISIEWERQKYKQLPKSE